MVIGNIYVDGQKRWLCRCDSCNKDLIRVVGKAFRGNHHFCNLKCRSTCWRKNPKGWKEVNKKRSEALKGSKSHLWKGGKFTTGGYVFVYSPGHPACGTKTHIMEHRLVMEKHIGRYLRPEEVVHHLDGDTTNNDIKNLKLFDIDANHQRYHKKIRLGLA